MQTCTFSDIFLLDLLLFKVSSLIWKTENIPMLAGSLVNFPVNRDNWQSAEKMKILF